MLKRLAFPVLLLLSMAAGGLLTWILTPYLSNVGEKAAAIGAGGAKPAPAAETRRRVTALGRIEPAGGLISLGALAGDRLAALNFKEGDPVNAGDIVGILESHDLRAAERALAAAQLDDAKARLAVETAYGEKSLAEAQLEKEQLELDARAIDEQRIKLGTLQAAAVQAERDLARLTGLEAGLIAEQDMEHQKLVVEKSRDDVRAAEKALIRLEEARGLSERIAEAKLASARANLERLAGSVQLATLEKSVALAQIRVDQTRLKAPFSGKVVRVITRPGEMITPQPILQLADVSRMVVVAEVYETDLVHVKVGQKAELSSRALGETPLSGTVQGIGLIVGKNQVLSIDPTQSTDRRVAEVRIELPEPGRAAELIHHQVEVVIHVAP
jgi:HlyD family secretion protein